VTVGLHRSGTPIGKIATRKLKAKVLLYFVCDHLQWKGITNGHQ
jgi:hypothetical protein